MQAASLYDLSPLVRMMLMGIVVALGPLAWIGLRNSGAPPARRLQALTVLTLFLTFDLVLFVAFTRLTDSGLGCPDWPGCYGSASPVGATEHITAAQTAMPTGPVTHSKAWIEMIHRYLATGVGVLILTLTVGSWWTRRQGGRASPVHLGWPLGLHSGRLWRADGDDETLSRHRYAAPAGWPGLAGAAVCTGRGAPAGRTGEGASGNRWWAACRAVADGGAGCAAGRTRWSRDCPRNHLGGAEGRHGQVLRR